MIDLGRDVELLSSPLIFGKNDLLPEEQELVAKAVDKRVREVAAGRVLARRLLGARGFPEAPLLNGPHRAPLWPRGITGSISHSQTLCIVGVSTTAQTLGLDVEENTPLADELYNLVLVPKEARFLATRAASERGMIAKLIFSAKETVYKAQFPLTQKMLDFQDVELELELEQRRFTASVLPGLSGTFAITRDHLFTGLVVPRAE